MTAGSGNAQTLVRLERMTEADLRTALEIQKANARAWQVIAGARLQTINQLQICLDRYRKRGNS